MLPATLQFLIATIACAINERMQRKLDYTQKEVRVLKEIVAVLTGNARLSFTADQRRRLAVAGKALSPEEREKCCQIVKPRTILGWFRQMAARKYDSSESKVGRPLSLARSSSELRISRRSGCDRRLRALSRDGRAHPSIFAAAA